VLVGVTGASGFIGSALVQRHVDAGDEVRCLTRNHRVDSRRGLSFVDGDLTQPDARLTRFVDGVDVLYHCAGEVADEGRMRPINVNGTRFLLQAASGRIGRWVQLGSAGVYGRSGGAIREETPLDPRGTYETTKAESDALVMEARAAGRIATAVVLRPSIVFGPGMPNQSVVQLIQMVNRGLFFFIGRPGASANYVHVASVVDALILCARSDEADGRVYNLSDWCTMEEFVGTIAATLGRPRPRLRLPEGLVRRSVRVCSRFASLPLTETRVEALVSRARYSIDRIQRELNYAIRVPISAGLAQMITSGAAS
jgi:nucleoside-diphosphate-sugar epimerase